MARPIRILFTMAALLAAFPAYAATFKATAEEGFVTIYSTSKKPEHCEAVARFTYLDAGTRKDGWTSCGHFTTVPGKNVQVCQFKSEGVVAPILTGPVAGKCEKQP